MKKFVLLFSMLFALAVNAQDNYYSMYSFVVEPENQATVVKLIDDYYSNNKPEGIFVRLFENHFQDGSEKATHHIVFSGTQDALGEMYASNDEKFALFITQVNQHTKNGGGSALGRHISIHMDEGEGQRFPFQRIYLLQADDTQAFDEAYAKFHSKHRPDDTLSLLASPMLGEGWGEYNRVAVVGFKDMKSAIGGAGALLPEKAREARQKAQTERRANDGNVEIKGSALRILLGAW
ncbi:hypothetical protein MWU50_04285 [Flavobacteriaceae bacterium S0862]|nr:hypothetical protein [Flavobacteriaceae bacterium S0862]